jgi:hypothetical protein
VVVVVVVVVVVDFDGDGDGDVDATVDGQTILVSIATTPSSNWPPRAYWASVMTLRSLITSKEAAHSIASPRAIL